MEFKRGVVQQLVAQRGAGPAPRSRRSGGIPSSSASSARFVGSASITSSWSTNATSDACGAGTSRTTTPPARISHSGDETEGGGGDGRASAAPWGPPGGEPGIRGGQGAVRVATSSLTARLASRTTECRVSRSPQCAREESDRGANCVEAGHPIHAADRWIPGARRRSSASP